MLFRSRFSLATNTPLRRTGIVYAGAGFGGAVFSVITAGLLKRFGLPWTFRLTGIIIVLINIPTSLYLHSRIPRQPLRNNQPIIEWCAFHFHVSFACLTHLAGQYSATCGSASSFSQEPSHSSLSSSPRSFSPSTPPPSPSPPPLPLSFSRGSTSPPPSGGSRSASLRTNSWGASTLS